MPEHRDFWWEVRADGVMDAVQQLNLSSLYLEQVKRIRELFSLVPEAMRSKLQWHGPQ